MKKYPWTKIFVLVLLGVILASQPVLAEGLTRIADNVYSYIDIKGASKDNSFGANAGIIIGNDGIVVIDTLISAKEARRFIKDIRAISDKPIRYVVNTHYHLDHAFGNSEFEKLGAIIIAQDKSKELMKSTAADTLKNIDQFGLTQEDMAGTYPAYPALTYGDHITIDIGNEIIDLIHARYSHTTGDTLVYIRGKNILFAGDILFTNYHAFLGEGNIGEWMKQLDNIKKMNVERIIPGHGPISGQKDLDDMKSYLTIFDRTAKSLSSRIHDASVISAELKKILPPRAEGEFLILGNVQMKYLNKSDKE